MFSEILLSHNINGSRVSKEGERVKTTMFSKFDKNVSVMWCQLNLFWQPPASHKCQRTKTSYRTRGWAKQLFATGDTVMTSWKSPSPKKQTTFFGRFGREMLPLLREDAEDIRFPNIFWTVYYWSSAMIVLYDKPTQTNIWLWIDNALKLLFVFKVLQGCADQPNWIIETVFRFYFVKW